MQYCNNATAPRRAAPRHCAAPLRETHPIISSKAAQSFGTGSDLTAQSSVTGSDLAERAEHLAERAEHLAESTEHLTERAEQKVEH